jgi:ribonucleotide reductase class II
MSFNFEASTANAVFYRSYSRRQASGFREDWNAVTERTLQGLIELGNLRKDEIELIRKMQNELKAMPSGRWLWVGGTEWSKQPKNFFGSYNCSNTLIIDWHSFGIVMNLAMQGCGTGTLLEDCQISKLPVIKNRLSVEITGKIGKTPKEYRGDKTTLYKKKENTFIMIVGDSRDGWVKAYQSLLEISSDECLKGLITIKIDVSDVRSKGEKLRGFGGTANPVKLPEMFINIANILNKAATAKRQLTSVECCLILDEAAVTIVAGNIRRSASIRQFSSNDKAASEAKDNLWQQDDSGNWKIDPERDALRMSNHTRVFHHKPTFEECLKSATKQFHSGEGAIQWAGEAVARSNKDLLNTETKKIRFLDCYSDSPELAKHFLASLVSESLDGDIFEYQKSKEYQKELEHRMNRYGLNPCGLSN